MDEWVDGWMSNVHLLKGAEYYCLYTSQWQIASFELWTHTAAEH